MSDPPTPDADGPSRERTNRLLNRSTTPHTNGNWKVLGETDDPGVIGVLGHNTSGSGVNSGVKGVVESGVSGTTGIEGRATARSGRTFGVYGKTSSLGSRAAGVAGEARGSGVTYGIWGFNRSLDLGAAAVRAEGKDSAAGLVADAVGNHGTYSSTANAVASGILGVNESDFNTSSPAYGIEGRTKGVGKGAAGVKGEATKGSGVTYGVEGETSSTDQDAAGVRGLASGGSGKPTGVLGESRDPDGTGVVGRSTIGSGVRGDGVVGITSSTGGPGFISTRYAAGVRGKVSGTSGEAFATAGVIGTNRAATGTSHGIFGKSETPNLDSAGVRGESTGSGTGVQAASSSGIGMTAVGVSRSSDDTPTPSEHVARVEDKSVSLSSVMALQAAHISPATAGDHNFITFYDAVDDAVGRIENDGSSGIRLRSGGADYAEFMPRRDPNEEIEEADVVGVVGGTVTKRTDEADRSMVVTDQAIVTGNAPQGREPDSDHEQVAFVGQVPVKVRGTVDVGDLVVPSGRNDGTGTAIAPADLPAADGSIVGQAWEATDDEGVDRVTVGIGVTDLSLVGEHIENLRSEIDRLKTASAEKDDRIAALEAENDALRSRLSAVEDHLDLSGPAMAPGDD